MDTRVWSRAPGPAGAPRRSMRAAAAGLAALTLALVASRAPAQQPAVSDIAMPHAEARHWLARVQQAARSGNYEGTLVYSTGGQVTSSRVRHYSVGGQTYELPESMDGRRHRIVRHNDVVQTVWPGSQVAVVEKREKIGRAHV